MSSTSDNPSMFTMAWAKKNIVMIIIVVIIIIGIIYVIASRSESYIGQPLSNLRAWDSGGKMRMSSLFSATNQGTPSRASQEAMGPSGFGPSYMTPWYGSIATPSVREWATTDPPTAESYAQPVINGGSLDDRNLARRLYK